MTAHASRIALLACAALAVGTTARASKDNAASSCDNLVQNAVANDCYVVTPVVTTAPITIDGAATGAEWTGAISKSLAGSLAGSHTVQLRHIRTGTTDQLVLFVTIADPSNAAEDFVSIIFDPLHNDHVPTAGAADDDVMFKIFRGSDNGPGAPHAPRRITKASDAEWAPTSGAFAVTSSSASWSFELLVDAPELLISHLPSAVGFGVQTSDFDGNTAVWPLNFSAPVVITAPFTNLAVFKNRLPIDYVLSLDYSGSMTALDGLADNRWKRTVHAADMFVAVAGLFRDPDYFDDRVGGSRYAWDCGNDAVAGDKTELFPGGGAAISSFPASGTDLFASKIAPDPPGNNCTPIKRGLQFALTQFAPSTFATAREHFIVLLSDGFHNMPSGDAAFGTTPTLDTGGLAFLKVRTVSMGPDATAGTALLAKLADAINTPGFYSNEAKYNQLAAADNLLNAYLETLQQPLHVNIVGDDAPASSDGSFAPGTVDRLVFIGSWDVPGNAKPLTIERDGVAVAGTAIGPNTTIGFSAVVIDHPQAGGTWKFAGPVANRPNHRHVLTDLRVYAEFFTEPRIYDTGEPILLQVRLRDAGKPVLGASVTVEAAIPGQGLGNFLSTTDPECKLSAPGFPAPITRRTVALAREPGAAVAHAPATAAAAAASTGTPDPRPGRYALAQQLLDRCQKTDDKTNLPGTPMFDDGTHGDLLPGDGVYSLAFGTTLEGSYNFRFHVRGKESTGLAFSRTSLLSQYVQVAPTQSGTQTTVQIGPVVNGLQTAAVLFIPRDNLGNYVGPGFPGNFHIKIPGGVAIGDVTDLGRGVYGQQIGYRPGTSTPPVIIVSDDPHVTIVVGGKGVGGKGVGGLVAWLTERCCYVLLVLVVLLLLLLIAVIRRRRP